MTKRCLDEAILQAYIDGELPPEKSAEAAAHAAACESCADALARAAAEASFFASAFAPDETLGVPTEALRSRIGAAVARLDADGEAARPARRGLASFFAPLAALLNFSPQGAAAFATLAALLALGAVYFTSQKARRTPSKSEDARQVAQVAPASERPSAVNATPEGVGANRAPAATKGTAATVPVKFSRAPRRAAAGNPGAKPRAAEPKEEVLPGEGAYQTAIASLEKTIKLGGDESLKPALRAQYERNLALLDSAITQTRQVAAQNPKDRDAVGFLMSAYQSKLELLTKVADQAQVAALGR